MGSGFGGMMGGPWTMLLLGAIVIVLLVGFGYLLGRRR